MRVREARRAVAWSLPGFGPMTRISASFGEVHAQTLRQRDMVRTQTGQLAEIRKVDRVKLDAAFLEQVPDAYAVLIRAGALGGGLPKADVIVSPAQKIAFGRMPRETEFREAREFLGRPGIVRKPEEMMTYTVFSCAAPVTVRTEGIWARVEP